MGVNPCLRVQSAVGCELGILFHGSECSSPHITKLALLPIACNIRFVCPSASTFFREAAKECRRRKKEYVKCLESRVAVLEVQNKKLIEELETLKDICSPKTD